RTLPPSGVTLDPAECSAVPKMEPQADPQGSDWARRGQDTAKAPPPVWRTNTGGNEPGPGSRRDMLWWSIIGIIVVVMLGGLIGLLFAAAWAYEHWWKGEHHGRRFHDDFP